MERKREEASQAVEEEGASPAGLDGLRPRTGRAPQLPAGWGEGNVEPAWTIKEMSE
jgi:hypothetical protein